MNDVCCFFWLFCCYTDRIESDLRRYYRDTSAFLCLGFVGICLYRMNWLILWILEPSFATSFEPLSIRFDSAVDLVKCAIGFRVSSRRNVDERAYWRTQWHMCFCCKGFTRIFHLEGPLSRVRDLAIPIGGSGWRELLGVVLRGSCVNAVFWSWKEWPLLALLSAWRGMLCNTLRD